MDEREMVLNFQDRNRKCYKIIKLECRMFFFIIVVNVKMFLSSLKYGSQVIIMLSSCNKKRPHQQQRM